MADSKTTQLSEETSVQSTDLLYLIDDPGGSPTSKKATVANVLAAGGTKAPVDAQYLTLAANGTLTNERTLGLGPGLQGSDAGAGGAYTVNLDPLAGLATYNTKLARQEATALNAGGTVTMIDYSGSGMVTNIWAALGSIYVWRDTQIKIYVDGEASPSVTFDVGALGLHFLSSGRFTTRHIGIGELTANYWSHFVFKYPIPFSSHIKIEAYNPSGTNGTIYSQVFYTTDITSSKRLKGSNQLWSTSISAGGSHNFLNLTGGEAGVIVWHSLICTAPTNNTFMESDVNCYVDGEATPSISSTGTEDWFMSAWYYYNVAHTMPPYAYVSVIDQTNHYMAAGVDLWELFGGIKFTNGVRLAWDCTESTTDINIAYLVLYYED